MDKNTRSIVLVTLVLIIAGVSFYWYKRQRFFTEKMVELAFDMDKVVGNNIVPIAIIGSGCAGLSSAIYGARANIKTVVIAGPKPGGALTETTWVENWPGDQKILGPKLMENMRKQAEHLGAEVLSDTVVKVDLAKWPYKIETEGGKKINALSIIIATGATPRTLNVPGEKTYWGKGVTTCAVCDAAFHKNNDVVVVGGGDSAVEEALQLAGYAKSIKILVRKDSMRAAPSMKDKLNYYDHISIVYNTEITKINGDDRGVTSIEIVNNKSGQQQTLPVKGVFLAIGSDPNVSMFKQYIKLDDKGYVWTQNETQQTSVPGVYAAGDVEDFRYKQAGVSAGDGIKSALDAIEFLRHHGYNSTVAKKLESRFFDDFDLKRLDVKLISTKDEFEKLQKSKSIVVLDFFAPYCPSCMHMLPAVETVAHHLMDKAIFAKVDTSQSTELAELFHVNSIPCLLVFKDGQLIARHHQAMSRKELMEFMQQFISQS